MKRKYLLRGIGIGLCIGVAVSYTAFKTGNYVSGSESSTSTEQMTEDPTKASEEQAKQEAEAQKASEEKAKQEAEEQKASEEKAKQEAEQKASEEKAKQEAEQKASEEKAKQEEEQKNQGQTVEIEVKRGMSSEKIARLLQENGLVDNAADFDKWLKNNKYSNKLHCGTMTIKKGLTYEELAKELTTQGR